MTKQFLTFMASKGLKLSFTLNCVKRANDLKRFQIASFCFRFASEISNRSA